MSVQPCSATCKDSSERTDNAACYATKDRYGMVDDVHGGCSQGAGSGCPAGCEVLASSLADSELQGFVDCMQDGSAACLEVQSCASLLPITQ